MQCPYGEQLALNKCLSKSLSQKVARKNAIIATLCNFFPGFNFSTAADIFDKEKIKVYRGRPLVLEPRDVHKADRQQYNGGLVFFAVVLRDVTFPFKAVFFFSSLGWKGTPLDTPKRSCKGLRFSVLHLRVSSFSLSLVKRTVSVL